MSRINNIPLQRAVAVSSYAEDPKNWLPTESTKIPKQKLSKHTIKTQKMTICYHVAYKNGDKIGELPSRFITFIPSQDHYQNEVDDFVQRTLKLFKFLKPLKIKTGKEIAYKERMFELD